MGRVFRVEAEKGQLCTTYFPRGFNGQALGVGLDRVRPPENGPVFRNASTARQAEVVVVAFRPITGRRRSGVPEQLSI